VRIIDPHNNNNKETTKKTDFGRLGKDKFKKKKDGAMKITNETTSEREKNENGKYFFFLYLIVDSIGNRKHPPLGDLYPLTVV
jgi:hypothetical protein